MSLPKSYTSISIIYNPTSTGASRTNAFRLADQLQAADITLPVYVTPTDFAGHAESLAYELAKATAHPLIISSSGDGGYNEIINGALRAQAEGAEPTCGLLPSGNANDHYRNLHQQPITGQILNGRHRHIDVLKLSTQRHGQPWERYAHSYIGIGLTPKIAIELNKVKLNRLREAWIVAKTLYRLKPSRLIVHGREHTYDSLIFSNVSKMSKILSVSDSAELTDGKFEVISFPSQTKLRLLQQLLKASTVGLHISRQANHFSFKTVRQTRVQLDGEIFRIDGAATAHITVEPKSLRCII